jgi:hypothetical protein
MKVGIDEVGAFVNFGDAIEEEFALGLDGLGAERIVVWLIIFAWGRNAPFLELGAGERSKRFGAMFGGGEWAVAEVKNGRAHGFELGDEMAGDEESHLAFDDGAGLPELEKAFLHFCVWAAEVTRIDGDIQTGEGKIGEWRGELTGRTPGAWDGFGGCGIGGEAESKFFWGGERDFDDCGIRLDGDDAIGGACWSVDGEEKADKFWAGDSFLVGFELTPIWGSCEWAKSLCFREKWK